MAGPHGRGNIMGMSSHYDFVQYTLPANNPTSLYSGVVTLNTNLCYPSWDVQALGQIYANIVITLSVAAAADVTFNIVGVTENSTATQETITIAMGDTSATTVNYFSRITTFTSDTTVTLTLGTHNSYAIVVSDGASTSHFVSVVGTDSNLINWTLSAALFQFKQKDNRNLLNANYYNIAANYTTQSASTTYLQFLELPVGRFKLSLAPATATSTNSLVWQVGFKHYQ